MNEQIVDRYDLTILKNDFELNINPIKKGLQLHRRQINGLGDVVKDLSLELESTNKKLNSHLEEDKIDKLGAINYGFNQADKICILDDKIIELENKCNLTNKRLLTSLYINIALSVFTILILKL